MRSSRSDYFASGQAAGAQGSPLPRSTPCVKKNASSPLYPRLARAVGYANCGNFHVSFKRRFGRTPDSHRHEPQAKQNADRGDLGAPRTR